jgi:hypothetical protein
MKDTNFNIINDNIEGQLIEMEENVSSQIQCSLDMDSNFLMSHGLMDYSLLLTIESFLKKPSLNNLKFPHRILRDNSALPYKY